MLARPASPADEQPGSVASQTSPPSPVSHIRSSFCVYDFSVALRAGAQALILCIHDDFVVSDSPIVVHLGRDARSLGGLPPTDDARCITKIGLLSHLGDEQEVTGDEEHSKVVDKRERDNVAEEGDQDGCVGGARHGRGRQEQRRPAHGNRLLPGSAPIPDSAHGSRGFALCLAAAIALLIVLLVGPRRQHSPVAESTLIKPLDPSPDTAFADLMQRHAAVPSAVIGSGATDKRVYSALLWDADEYCGELRLMLAANWARNSYAPDRAPPGTAWQQGWAWIADRAREDSYHGRAHARAKSLCESFDAVLTPLISDIVVPLHRFMVAFWGAHAVSGLLTAGSGL